MEGRRRPRHGRGRWHRVFEGGTEGRRRGRGNGRAAPRFVRRRRGGIGVLDKRRFGGRRGRKLASGRGGTSRRSRRGGRHARGVDLFDRIASEAVRNAGVVTAETAGVQSLAPEMLGVFLLCFAASVLLMSSKKGKGYVPRSQMAQPETKRGDAPGVEQRPEDVVLHGIKHKTSNHDNDSHSTLTAESTMKIGPNGIRDQPLKASLANRVAVSFLSLVLIPLKLARLLMLFGKEIFLCGWFFLSEVSQYKAPIGSVLGGRRRDAVGRCVTFVRSVQYIKPSSLEYRTIPSTTVSINSLDAKATLDVYIVCSSDYPYVKFLNVSLVKIPEFNLRIEPQSESSGLKGVDFGSFPVVSKWIKSSINSALAEYLSPQYISIDVLAWLRGDDKIATYFGAS
ncbi:hypothetical protein ACHAWF_016813 [Thalassiosira exigua]